MIYQEYNNSVEILDNSQKDTETQLFKINEWINAIMKLKFSLGRVIGFIILVLVSFKLANGYMENLALNMPECIDYFQNPNPENERKMLEACRLFDRNHSMHYLIMNVACIALPALICFLGSQDKKGFYQNPPYPQYPPRY